MTFIVFWGVGSGERSFTGSPVVKTPQGHRFGQATKNLHTEQCSQKTKSRMYEKASREKSRLHSILSPSHNVTTYIYIYIYINA